MYKLLNAQTGEQLGIVENPLFIKKSASGCYVGCQPGEAIGIAYKSVAYNLVGHADIPETATIIPVEFESGDTLADQQQQTTDLQVALVESYESSETQLTDLQVAIVELYEMLFPEV